MNFTEVETSLIETAREYAIVCHHSVNHQYDGKPYLFHLKMVYDDGLRYINLLTEAEVKYALAACWTHDTIEDCRQTYNDVEKVCGHTVAEITYALTNEKGKNRKERANEKYYEGIRNTPLAVFVKLCDRLANVKYSKDNPNRMIDAYRKEHPYFKEQLYKPEHQPIWDELTELLSL